MKSKEWLSEIIYQCLEKDQKAWVELIDFLQPRILTTCRNMRLSQEESLDVFGQVCYILLRHLKDIKDPGKVVAWVITTTRREALSHERRSTLLERIEKQAAELDPPIAPEQPDEYLEELRKSEILFKAISLLKYREERLIYLLYLDPSAPSYEQISAVLNMPVSSIGPTKARVLDKLLKIMKRLGYKF